MGRLWRDIHILIISLLIGCILFVNFSPNNGKFSNRTVKTPLFLLVAVYAVAPLYHWISLNNTLAYNSLDITSNVSQKPVGADKTYRTPPHIDVCNYLARF